MKKVAFDYVKNKVDYPRPVYDFPDLSSENGNPYHFWPLIYRKLNELGFKKEAQIFSDRMGFRKYSFEDNLQLISYFLDFNPENSFSNSKIIKEDNDYVYLKVKKELIKPESNLKQPYIFKVKDIATFKELLEDEDFSIKNCYGRTFLHYIDEPGLLNYFLKINEDKKLIDLIDLDNFNSTYLHSTSNLECFSILFNEMISIDIEMTDTFLFGNDVFGNCAYNNFISLLTKHLQSESGFINFFENSNNIVCLKNILISLNKVSPSEYNAFKEQLFSNDIIVKYLHNNNDIKDILDKTFLFVEINKNLEPNKISKKSNKI